MRRGGDKGGVCKERERRDAGETERKKMKQGNKLGMDADFCQQEVSVTMVTRQKE